MFSDSLIERLRSLKTTSDRQALAVSRILNTYALINQASFPFCFFFVLRLAYCSKRWSGDGL